MSTIKVTNIQHPSAEGPAIELDPVDGVVFSAASFDADAIASGTLDVARVPNLDAAKITSGVLDAARVPLAAGIGSNVVSTTKTDVFTHNTGTYTEVTGLTATITPSSDTAKVLVFGHLSWNLTRTTGDFGRFRIVRGVTAISLGNAAGVRAQATGSFSSDANNVNTGVASFVFVDEPTTNAPVTYAIEIARGIAALRINATANDGDALDRARTTSSITAIEVSA